MRSFVTNNSSFSTSAIIAATALAASCTPAAHEDGVGSQSSAIVGQWSVTSTNLGSGRAGELHGAVLSNGDVLFVSGEMANNTTSSATDLYTTTGFASKSILPGLTRRGIGLVGLADGSALAASGGTRIGSSITTFINSARWNVATQDWQAVGSMIFGRYLPSATLLADGKVLIAGGAVTNTQTIGMSKAEIFDPSTNQFTQTAGDLPSGRANHVAALLPNGKVLIVGGTKGPSEPQATVTFSPSTGLFTNGVNMVATGRVEFAGARLPDGRILYCGGCTSDSCASGRVNTCEIYDGTNDTVVATGSMVAASSEHSMITLPTGKILLAGGVTSTILGRAEIYDPTAGTWSTTGPFLTARTGCSLALLPDGRVLCAGGVTLVNSQPVYLTSAEIYDPGTPTVCDVKQLDGTTNRLANGTVCVGGACQAGVCVVSLPEGGTEAGTEAGTDASDASAVSDASDATATTDASDASDASDGNDAPVATDTGVDTSPVLDATPDAPKPIDAAPIVDATPDAAPTVDASAKDAAQEAATPTPDANADAGSTPTPSSGCQCRQGPAPMQTPWGFAAGLALVLAGLRRVRSRASSTTLTTTNS